MNLSNALAQHLQTLHYGGNWTAVHIKDVLKEVDWQLATQQIEGFNSISKLVYHINYYSAAILKVFEGGPLDASDKFSFDVPPINSASDWDAITQKLYQDADRLIERVDQYDPQKWMEPFAGGKYGSYYRNVAGLIEHSHYHLGQIVIIKKMLVLKG